MHLPRHQRQLMQRTDSLDNLIEQIREENPAALHTSETLSERVFFHQPAREIPHADYLEPVHPDDPRFKLRK